MKILQASGRMALLVLVPFSLGSCNKKMHLPFVPNDPPTVRLTAAPVDTVGPDGKRLAYYYAYKLDWVGYDPDGRVDHFLYAIDKDKTPPGQPVHWVSTTLNEKTFFFRSSVPLTDSTGKPLASELAEDFHIFSIKAVDDRGAESPLVERGFFSFTQAPTVDIGSPTPSHLSWALVGPFVRIAWTGKDPDGLLTSKPVKYKFKLFKNGNSDFEFDMIFSNPDSLRRYYAPTFAGWDSTGPDSAFALFSNLTPNSDYMFVVVGFDEAGAYSPIFSLDHNIIWLRVSYAGVSGPLLNVWNEFFDYSYRFGGFPTTPPEVIARTFYLEVPGHQPIRFNWAAAPGLGIPVKQYRWMMDNQNLSDETPRSNESTDWYHWSQWAFSNTSCTVGPFDRDSTHFLYIEAEDVGGMVSLGIIQMRVAVPPPPNEQKPLLIVNDTRLEPDQELFVPDPSHPDSLQAPAHAWPTRAECDTFLFAVGGVRWRMTPGLGSSPPAPADTKSYPGLFAGYAFDTVYTNDLYHHNLVTLSELVRYQHVVWIADAGGSNEVNFGGLSALYVMSQAGSANTLSAYTALGGRVWMCGGGVAAATTKWWNSRANDILYPGALRFSGLPYGGKPAELVPGRYMYDFPHWRSEIWCVLQTGPIYKSVRIPADRSWTNTKYGVSCPAYSLLPDRLEQKGGVEANSLYNPDGTQRYPFRSDDILLRIRAWPAEVLPGDNNTSLGMGIGANSIIENVSDNPDSQAFVSTLDTLYQIMGGNLLPRANEDLSNPATFNENVIMTYYHGLDCAPIVFSGFDLWSAARPELIGLIDFVLQQIWGLPRQNVDRNGTNGLRPAHQSVRPAVQAGRGASSIRLR